MWRFLYILCICVTLVAKITSDCVPNNSNKKKQLRDDLYCNHDASERPVLNHKDATNVAFSIILKNIEYDMYASGLTVNFWMTVSWLDQLLTWKPEDYDDIQELIVDVADIWKPDLSVYNRLDQSGSPTMMEVEHCILTHKGQISCVAPNMHEILCTANFKYFPFDTQECSMAVGSWIHGGEELNISTTKIGVSRSDFEDVGEWRLKSVNVTHTKGVYEELPNVSFPYLNFHFVIERHSAVQVCLFIVPALVLFVLTMISFLVDIKDKERTFIVCINILVHMIFSRFIGWSLPISGPITPLIVLYTRDSLILTTFTLILTMMQRKLIACKRESPSWIATVTGYAMNSRVIQLIFMFDGNLKDVAERLGDDDGRNIIENVQTTSTPSNNDWLILAKVMDRFAMIVYFFVYVCMCIAFIP